jgi:hexosaminidase
LKRAAPYFTWFLFIFWLIAGKESLWAQPALIPFPQSFQTDENQWFHFDQLSLAYGEDLEKEKELLLAIFVNHYAHPIQAARLWPGSQANIHLKLDEKLSTSAYQIHIDAKRIQISGGDKQALFYALQTFRQLLLSYPKGRLPALKIDDFPRFGWRGMHLDCSRHFFTVAEIKKYLDLLALYKFNVFHWHLTDDQGWRAEIKAFPELSRTAAWRNQTLIGRPGDGDQFDGKPYGGYYSQDDMREIVAYAAERHISVVPEIEMPGHALAALAAYPQLSCTGGPFTTGQSWGVYEDVFCAGNDSVFSFLEQVLTEIMAIFPSEYIHIGGDECPKIRWKSCYNCQKRMADVQLADENELQSWFINRIGRFLQANGRQFIGWDEILEGGLPNGAAVMSWRGESGGLQAAKMGHKVVMSPVNPCYFDYYQFKDRESQPLAIGGYNPLSAVYAFDPIPKSLPDSMHTWIMGGQANVWTEYINTYNHLGYMVMPRMAAMAEALWLTADKRDFTQFNKRLQGQKPWLDSMGIPYAPASFEGKPE